MSESEEQDSEVSPDDTGGRSGTHPVRSTRQRLVRGVGIAVVLVTVFAVPILGRVGWEGRAELEFAREAALARDTDLQVEHLGRAARWRAPVLGHDEQAIARLMEIGVDAQARGSNGRQLALTAFREVRRALLATRTWWVPQADVFQEANERIASMMADQERAFDTDISGDGDAYAYHLALLQEIPGPNPIRGNLAALAFVVWVACGAGFVWRGLDAKGGLASKPAVRWGAACLASLAAWVLLLRWAQ